MDLSQLELDRNINRLRIHSVEFSELPDEELVTLLEKTVQNIHGIAYYLSLIHI